MLEKGVKAPEFEGVDQDDNPIKLSDFTGKKVILYFYPKDNTPGCTVQACNLRDNYQTLLEQGYVVIGVSQDTSASHKKFIAKQNLPFPLIADTDHTVHNLFGVWAEKKMYGKTYMGTLRTTFVINGEGVIDEVIAKVKTKEHTAQILG
ncbi:MAG: peroxiredoxin Q/BCP [Cyclobacteriaceae bacterium]|jgi:peroxiredoxin Q/BCP